VAQAELASTRVNTNQRKAVASLRRLPIFPIRPARLAFIFAPTSTAVRRVEANGRDLAACPARSRKQWVVLCEQLSKQRPTSCIHHGDACGGCHRSWSPSAVWSRLNSKFTLHVTITVTVRDRYIQGCPCPDEHRIWPKTRLLK
jgi:hypothetical protein